MSLTLVQPNLVADGFAKYTKAGVSIFGGDALERLRALPDCSVDSVVTDPPYGLTGLSPKKVREAITRWVTGDPAYIPGGTGFMGQLWDRFVPPPALWAEVLRVLKPGGHVAVFAASRTAFLMTTSMALAGFEVKDPAHWLRADSFPKTKHSLAPGFEPAIIAHRPFEGTQKANYEKWGVGYLRPGEVRIPFRNAADEAETKGKNKHGQYGTAQGGNKVFGDYSGVAARADYDPDGRHPKTILMDEAAAELIDASVDGWDAEIGGPSRFFSLVRYAGRATAAERPVIDGESHTTIKPLSIMRWLVRLCTPEGGLVLDPFLGSGTTAEAALLEGYRVAGVELQPKFLPHIALRLDRAIAQLTEAAA